MKLTKVQIEVIAKMYKKNTYLSKANHWFSGSHYYLMGNKVGFSTIDALKDKGAIEINPTNGKYYLTQEAKDYINTLKIDPPQETPTVTMYRTSSLWQSEISEVEVTKESDSFIWIKSEHGTRRTAKQSNYECYYPTRAEAIAALTLKHEKLIQGHKDQLESAETNFNKFKQKYL